MNYIFCKYKMEYNTSTEEYECIYLHNNISLNYLPAYHPGYSTLILHHKNFGEIFFRSVNSTKQSQTIDEFINQTKLDGFNFYLPGKKNCNQIKMHIKDSILSITPDNFLDKINTILTFQ